MRNLITKGESLLEKEANAFKKSFSNNNRIAQSIYISLVSALTLSILKKQQGTARAVPLDFYILSQLINVKGPSL